ncbi:predicted protein [Uncinocarpus reesii 1704]|uniref:BTB domain-containing protein n=1 Tax=Uncinocarpus reesii (strain UAMH 1704) TaxID=336963 RepID=C4JTM7_UNCRE|nr:uncharacterized protein UREG_05816 [Uncinocarpus reesii 1704]EEP80974.1 predicted protein [Uncinocarpus reesii 1704]
MEPEYYELDPDGDVLLVLRTEEPKAEDATAAKPTGDGEGDGKSDGDDESKAEAPKDETPKVEAPQEVAESIYKTTRFRLSSKHLSLASLYFKRMFTGGWKEGQSLGNGQPLEISEEGWKPESFLILMRIIHGRTKEVPRKAPLETIAEMASLVDYFECGEVMGIFVEFWIAQLGTLPAQFSRDTVLCIWINYVFRRPKFQNWTRLAIRKSSGPITALEFPLPDIVINQMNEQREEAIERIVEYLYGLFDDFQSKNRCSLACSCMMLGALTKHMCGLKLFPRPSRPFAGLQLAALTDSLDDITTPDWTTRGSYSSNHPCKLAHVIRPTLESLEDSIIGLKLEEFPGPGSAAKMENGTKQAAS